MSTLNLSNCGTTANTGVARCGFDPALFQYAIFIPKGFVIPAASITTADAVMTYVQNKLEADSRNNRWFRTPLLTNLDNKTDAVKEEDRDGFKKSVFTPSWNLNWFINGTICDFQNLLQFSYQQNFYDVLIVDAKNVVLGRKAADTTGAIGLGGFSMYEIFVPEAWKPTTVSTGAQYMLSLKFQKNADYGANLGYIDCSASTTTVASMVGLVSATIITGTTTPNTSSAIYVSGTFGCGSNSIGGYYGSVLNTSSAWIVTSSAGVSRTVSGVTYNSTLDQFVIASSAAFANGDLVRLAAPSVLLALSGAPNIVTESTYTVAI